MRKWEKSSSKNKAGDSSFFVFLFVPWQGNKSPFSSLLCATSWHHRRIISRKLKLWSLLLRTMNWSFIRRFSRCNGPNAIGTSFKFSSDSEGEMRNVWDLAVIDYFIRTLKTVKICSFLVLKYTQHCPSFAQSCVPIDQSDWVTEVLIMWCGGGVQRGAAGWVSCVNVSVHCYRWRFQEANVNRNKDGRRVNTSSLGSKRSLTNTGAVVLEESSGACAVSISCRSRGIKVPPIHPPAGLSAVNHNIKAS